MRFIEHVITVLVTLALVGALAWFGAPRIAGALAGYVRDAQQAKDTTKAQAGALTADTAAANRQQQSCSAEVSHAMDAAKAIAQASKPVSAVQGQPRPMITADQIKAMIQ